MPPLGMRPRAHAIQPHDTHLQHDYPQNNLDKAFCRCEETRHYCHYHNYCDRASQHVHICILGTLSASPFGVHFKQEELTQTSANATSGGTSSGTGNSTSPDDVLSSSALSTRAKAGIGVGATFGVLLLVALGFFLYHRRVRRQKHQEQGVTPDWLSNEHKAELHLETYKAELRNGTVQLKELSATQKVSYLEVNPTAPAELETHHR